MALQHNGPSERCPETLKDDNPDVSTVHCVIYRENLVAGALSPELDQVINFIKADPKTRETVPSCCFLSGYGPGFRETSSAHSGAMVIQRKLS